MPELAQATFQPPSEEAESGRGKHQVPCLKSKNLQLVAACEVTLPSLCLGQPPRLPPP